MSSRIVVTGRIPRPGLDRLREVGDVWAWDADEPIPTALRDERLADADAAVTLLTDRVDGEFLDAGPRLRIVANVAVGYNNIDVGECRRRGVVVTNTPDVLTDATADLALALMLMVTRRLGEGERLLRSGEAWKWSMFMMLGAGIQGRRIGIVGMGSIGQALAARAKACGMSVVYHNRSPVDGETERRLGARYKSFDELIETSDVVSLHCPYTPETHHLVDAAVLARMKPSAFLVNTARGAIVDEGALVDALRSGSIAGAGLDVFEHEPDIHPGLRSLDNVVLAPHLGSATVETRDAMSVLAARNVIEVLAGRDPITPVSDG